MELGKATFSSIFEKVEDYQKFMESMHQPVPNLIPKMEKTYLFILYNTDGNRIETSFCNTIFYRLLYFNKEKKSAKFEPYFINEIRRENKHSLTIPLKRIGMLQTFCLEETIEKSMNKKPKTEEVPADKPSNSLQAYIKKGVIKTYDQEPVREERPQSPETSVVHNPPKDDYNHASLDVTDKSSSYEQVLEKDNANVSQHPFENKPSNLEELNETKNATSTEKISDNSDDTKDISNSEDKEPFVEKDDLVSSKPPINKNKIEKKDRVRVTKRIIPIENIKSIEFYSE
ncbi:hypothetical protein HNQ94_003272 [Salirhabdus euzebyi]|uniref:Uncharacterized protein n=1 Tax=Salirhabdus euzebyi TaxID=394506 RepID=A0A841Q8Y7_9BACI|nr:hypothetical protein [Salirhabdus euzebyi]MBB6454783.1 hypothetical protein [Salirhabdus euzebyi]